MKNSLLFASVFIISFTASAQQNLYCGADELRISTLKNNHELAKAVFERENELETFTREFIAAKAEKDLTADTALYIIPVVFHIIHDYGNENIANEQIYSAVDMLNKTFRKQRDDTASIVEIFKPLHADTRIEFRLAKRDPDGNCHSGINRIASSLSETGDHAVKNLVHWNPANYLNVYVVKNAAGLAGHAIFPSDADTVPEWDGIVLSHNYVGTIGTSNLTQSVAFAHECGHYLNLQHIWGGNNVPGYYFLPCADPNHDCNIDDGVDDTPRTIGWQSCNLSGASCGSNLDNVQNVMDYSYCNIMFTNGQRDRMQAALNSPIGNRNNLWQPANLIATGVYDAPVLCGVDFSSTKKVVCPGGTITFNNESYHAPFDSVLWTFEGGTPANSTAEELEVDYNSEGVYDVSLTVYANGSYVSEAKSNFISVLPETGGTIFPFSESFETDETELESIGWFKNSFDSENNWSLDGQAPYSGTVSVMLDNLNNTMDTKDELYSPLIDLSQVTETNISFKYAFAGKTDSIADELQLQINKGCSNFWLNKLTINGAELETAAPQVNAFIPSSQQQWKQAVTNIPSSYFVDDFRFRFVMNGRGGNNIFIDDINIDVAAGVKENSFEDNSLKLFPNPTTGKINLVLPKDGGKIKEVKLLDSKGSLLAVFNNTATIDISTLSSGLYFVIAETENGFYRQRVVKD
ncbi:MAG: M43 family zinc metalloprotease [Bacteroidia bacterium]